jgi:2-(1,2-epoxy-1,2-dihydrophenyl)acetyl-CoA isomerase
MDTIAPRSTLGIVWMPDPAVTSLLVDQHDAVAVLTLNRPDRLNALNLETVDALLSALEALATDNDVRVVVLTGAGRGFCAGGDLEIIAGAGASPTASSSADQVRRHLHIAELLHSMSKPTIAAVNGPCAGAGMSLACAADFRVAARSAHFSTAFAKVGQSGDYGLAWSLHHLLGPALARRLFFLDRRIPAEEALGLGLVSDVYDDAELLPAALRLARGFADMPRLTVAALKGNLVDAARLPLDEYLDREAERFVQVSRTEDAREAARAYVSKRVPRFVGR